MRVYLGDSVYADVDHGLLKLTTENGFGPTNTILLDPMVYEALMLYCLRHYDDGTFVADP